jgi:hypothetical protein
MVNGDEKNSVLKNGLYFVQCLYNHRRGFVDNSITILTPKLDIDEVFEVGPTPGRLLCNGVWISLDYQNLECQLGGKLNFLDLGCGSGRYGPFLRDASKASFGNYAGMDIYKDVKFPAHYEHILGSAEDAIENIREDVNFLFSQSVLEHIKGDKAVLSAITGRLAGSGKPFIQIHMLPASASLWLYLWHGWRQYSFRNLCGIARDLKRDFNVDVYAVPLGGWRSFWTHLTGITAHKVLQNVFSRIGVSLNAAGESGSRIRRAVASESKCSNARMPIFWSLIIVRKGVRVKFKR